MKPRLRRPTFVLGLVEERRIWPSNPRERELQVRVNGERESVR